MIEKRILVVGSGFAGATFARLAAEDGVNVDMIDRRPHIGGNSYSYKHEKTGIEIHKYGPHIFHTNNERVYNFISRFTKLNSFVHRVKAYSGGHIYSFPINLHTINQFFGNSFSPLEAEAFIEKKRIKFNRVRNFEAYILNSLGQELYEAFFRDYTVKQWGRQPKDIPVTTARRLPIRFNYNDSYFNDSYQGIPDKGYGELFKKILDHGKINVNLNCDFRDIKKSEVTQYDKVIYSGSIDEYFDYTNGKLPYRKVTFKKIIAPVVQGTAVINYCDSSHEFTRIHEHQFFTPQTKFPYSVGFKEYSSSTTSEYNPYYPIESQESIELLSKYEKMAKNEKHVIFLGRLGNFKYLNMDQVIENAMSVYRDLKHSDSLLNSP